MHMMQGERVETSVSLCQSDRLPAFLKSRSTRHNSHTPTLLLYGDNLCVSCRVSSLDSQVVTSGHDLPSLVDEDRSYRKTSFRQT